MALFEPEIKPAVEFVRGRMLQKMSPKFAHGRLQGRLWSMIDSWSGGGAVAVEWRFYFAPPGAAWGSLVPDVAYVSDERVRSISPEELERPWFAPDIAVEILSLGDALDDVEWKTQAYLHGGTRLVLVVDPRERTIEVNDRDARRTLQESERFAHSAMPGFEFELSDLFAGVYREEP